MTLTITPLLNIPLIRHGNNLADILLDALHTTEITLQDGDILVLTQKIVSKAEGRMVNLAEVTPSAEALELATRSTKDPRLVELILRESNEVLRARPGLIIVEHRLGFVCANAGIDHSNVSPTVPLRGAQPRSNLQNGAGIASPPAAAHNDTDWYLLLPENPDRSAGQIRQKIESATSVRIGVLIIDSHGRAWREGTVGITLGLSGLPPLVDERGWKDLYGRELRITVVGIADELAAAASLVMGQAAEGTPVAHVRGFPYPLCEGSLKDILRPKNKDLFR